MGATSTAPIYRGLAAKGLIRKDYLNGDAGAVGVPLGVSRPGRRLIVNVYKHGKGASLKGLTARYPRFLRKSGGARFRS